MDYSSEVLRRLAEPGRVAAGSLPEAVPGVAEDRSLNVWVRFQVRARAGRLTELRYNVFGCPHTIAAADWFAEQLEGEPVSALRGLDLAAATEDLKVPRSKLGKLLRIEDALAACADQLERELPTNGSE